MKEENGDKSAYGEVRAYLYSLRYRGARYGIDRMRDFVDALGNPERQFPVVHIAGTNGKGSTCAMVESILRAAGLKTGMFTSPHLVHQGERVQVNREILRPHQIVAYVKRLRPIAEAIGERDPDLHPSFFEFMTGMAFLRFAEAGVDCGVIETGLGGRLDATNVVDPAICAITSISYDHTEILGDTLEEIAWEKAGILKPGKPVVIGCLPPEAERVIRKVALERDCPLVSVRERFGDNLDSYPTTRLFGEFQRRNAATAWLIAEQLQAADILRLPAYRVPEVVRRGLDTVDWAGRWDQRSFLGRTIIFDSTHNLEGTRELERNLERLLEEQGRKPIILAGTLGLQRAAALIPVVQKFARELILLRPNQPRACSFAELRQFLNPSLKLPVQESTVQDLFLESSPPGDPGDFLVVTGSIYLIGEILSALTEHPNHDDTLLQD